MAWVLNHRREATHAKLSEFHDKSEEDVIAERIYMIVAAYLKEVVINQWAGGNATNNLRDLLIKKFALDSTKDI